MSSNSSDIHGTITNTLNELTTSINGIGNGIALSEYLPASLGAPPSSPGKREVEMMDVVPLTGGPVADMNSGSTTTTTTTKSATHSPHQSYRRRKTSLAQQQQQQQQSTTIPTTTAFSMGNTAMSLNPSYDYQQFSSSSSSSSLVSSSRLSKLQLLSSSSTSSNSVQQLYELMFTLWCMTLDCHGEVRDVGSSPEPTNGYYEDEDFATTLDYSLRGGRSSDNSKRRRGLRQHFVRDGAITALVQLLNSAPREKVLRLALASLKNLATKPPSSTHCVATGPTADDNDGVFDSVGGDENDLDAGLVREMIACGILRSLEFLQLRTWTDDDLRSDLNSLHFMLQRYYDHHLTHWKVYRMQLDAGRFSWSSMLHTESFFRRNIRSFEGPNCDFEPLKLLVNILARGGKPPPLRTSTSASALSPGRIKKASSTMTNHSFYHLNDKFSMESSSYDDDEDEEEEIFETIAICLYDLGEFARFYPKGRVVAKKFGAKKHAMQYINHRRPDIQQESLLCVSKLLVHNWRVRTTSSEWFCFR
mmetsp:Transcript_58188/g.142269  ORF Transcript_58188/g.142269 Transcript_58188/m.142269 type:complete len:532 (+) Transcript_58188:308-1903(+)